MRKRSRRRREKSNRIIKRWVGGTGGRRIKRGWRWRRRRLKLRECKEKWKDNEEERMERIRVR